jgi:hypothetical protein
MASMLMESASEVGMEENEAGTPTLSDDTQSCFVRRNDFGATGWKRSSHPSLMDVFHRFYQTISATRRRAARRSAPFRHATAEEAAEEVEAADRGR